MKRPYKLSGDDEVEYKFESVEILDFPILASPEPETEQSRNQVAATTPYHITTTRHQDLMISYPDISVWI